MVVGGAPAGTSSSPGSQPASFDVFFNRGLLLLGVHRQAHLVLRAVNPHHLMFFFFVNGGLLAVSNFSTYRACGEMNCSSEFFSIPFRCAARFGNSMAIEAPKRSPVQVRPPTAL